MKPRLTDRCAHCRLQRGKHQAKTLHCPVGQRTRVGYIAFHPTNTFTPSRPS